MIRTPHPVQSISACLFPLGLSVSQTFPPGSWITCYSDINTPAHGSKNPRDTIHLMPFAKKTTALLKHLWFFGMTERRSSFPGLNLTPFPVPESQRCWYCTWSSGHHNLSFTLPLKIHRVTENKTENTLCRFKQLCPDCLLAQTLLHSAFTPSHVKAYLPEIIACRKCTHKKQGE